MKKVGFTLAELLVALGVISVLAAITAPMINSIIPDKNKAIVLKVYKTVSNINANLLGDKTLYIMNDDDPPCVGIECTELPGNPRYQDEARYTGTAKYCYLLADNLNITDEPVVVPARNAQGRFTSTITFDTTDGLHWTVGCASVRTNERTEPNRCNILIRTDDEAECVYGDCNNSKYNAFAFNVLSNGRLTGEDSLTRAYLMNPTKLNDKKADLKKAETLYAESGNADGSD